MQETLLTIDLNKLQQNAFAFKRYADRFTYAVVKADAYGHGAVRCVDALRGIADGFAVALIDEALTVKDAAAGKEILVFTPPLSADDVVVAAQNGFTLTVADLRSAKLVAETVKKYALTIDVQLKVNTGMNRYGCYGSAFGKVCCLLKGCGQVRVVGVYSHLYSHEKSLCEQQKLRFYKGVLICRKYFPLARAHLASTFGVCLGEEYLFDAVRIGLGVYGYFPEGNSPFALQPVMKAYAPCVATRVFRFGGAGYGTEREDLFGQRLSVLRCGYADGFGVRSEACGLLPPLVGSLCMDACLAEQVAKIGEKILLFDDANAVAKARGTSVYEVLCRAALRAKREYLT